MTFDRIAIVVLGSIPATLETPTELKITPVRLLHSCPVRVSTLVEYLGAYTGYLLSEHLAVLFDDSERPTTIWPRSTVGAQTYELLYRWWDGDVPAVDPTPNPWTYCLFVT